MKYADRLGIPYVLVIGENEVKESKVAFKDMISGNQELITVEEVIERLKKKKKRIKMYVLFVWKSILFSYKVES